MLYEVITNKLVFGFALFPFMLEILVKKSVGRIHNILRQIIINDVLEVGRKVNLQGAYFWEFSSDGTLSIDEDALSDALANNPDILTQVFSDTGGIFDALDDYLDPFTKTNGILATSLQSAQDNLESVEERQEKWDTKMEKLYNRYLAQFNQMIATMAILESNASLL